MKYSALLALALVSMNTFAANYTCVGTEPFFNIDVTGKSITLTSPELTSKITAESKLNAQGMSEGLVTVLKSKKNDVNLTIIAGPCSDGMSDEVYRGQMVYTKGDLVLYGCCNQK